jgi:uracil phosphoribosyltransferase
MIHVLNHTDSYLNTILAELRDVTVQHDRMRFRKNLERFGAMAAMEISKKVTYKDVQVTTPLGSATCRVPEQQPVVASILRAGLPLHNGVLEIFDHADNAFISAYRKHTRNDDSFEVLVEYLSSPNLDGRTVILCDPMLATGSSMVLAYKALLQKGRPSHVHVLATIGSQQGIDFVRSHLPENITIWIGSIDDELTAQAYIVPGLGDAGDLAYGEKLG